MAASALPPCHDLVMSTFAVVYSSRSGALGGAHPQQPFTGTSSYSVGQGGELVVTDDAGKKITIAAHAWERVEEDGAPRVRSMSTKVGRIY